MKISVIGCGRWGSFIAWYLDKIGCNITLYGRSDSEQMHKIILTRSNNMLNFSSSMHFTTHLEKALKADIIVISIPSQSLRDFTKELQQYDVSNKLFILCMKGLEMGTGNRLTTIMQEELPNVRTAVWLGPGHVQEFVRGIPNCMVIDSQNEEDKAFLVHSFSSDLIRFYYGSDLIGNEIGAAAKNVIGIAAGMLDGFGHSSLKGALMSRACQEISRLIVSQGGQELSAYGLCHLGDYEATVFSPYSHNRIFGELFVKQEPFDKLAEGYYTVRAIMTLANANNIELPICESVYKILYQHVPPKQALNMLFARRLKKEFNTDIIK